MFSAFSAFCPSPHDAARSAPRRRRTRAGLRVAFAAVTAGATAAVGLMALAGTAHAASTLGAAAAAQGRYFGAAVAANHLGEAPYAATLDAEFSAVTPENEMKWDATEPARGQFTFAAADQIVQHAQSHSMKIRGHTLVWYSQLPGWVGALGASELQSAMDQHITALMTHYKGDIYAWDVVNEAFQDGGSGARRSSPFQDELGDGYIEHAFRTARAADPGAKLCYNDYNIDGVNAKSNAVYAMVKDFRARGVPIDCVGFQGHFNSQSPVPPDYQANLQRFADLGVDVQITELDVAGSGAAQADSYATVVRSCLAVTRCTGITVWGITDKYSWRSSDTPLLFDADYARKPAYDAVLTALGGTGSTSGGTTTGGTTGTTTGGTGGQSCSAAYQLVNSWTGGYQAQVTVTNTGAAATAGWSVAWTQPPGASIVNLWNAVPATAGSQVTASNAAYNGALSPGSSTAFGYVAGGGPAPTTQTLSCTPR